MANAKHAEAWLWGLWRAVIALAQVNAVGVTAVITSLHSSEVAFIYPADEKKQPRQAWLTEFENWLICHFPNPIVSTLLGFSVGLYRQFQEKTVFLQAPKMTWWLTNLASCYTVRWLRSTKGL